MKNGGCNWFWSIIKLFNLNNEILVKVGVVNDKKVILILMYLNFGVGKGKRSICNFG